MKDFLFTLLAWLLTLPFIIFSVGFAIYNGQTSPVTISPFGEAIEMPLYVPVLGALAIGFVFGAIMTWAAMGRLRKERSDQKKKIKTLEKQIVVGAQTPAATTSYTLLPSTFVDKQ